MLWIIFILCIVRTLSIAIILLMVLALEMTSSAVWKKTHTNKYIWLWAQGSSSGLRVGYQLVPYTPAALPNLTLMAA